MRSPTLAHDARVIPVQGFDTSWFQAMVRKGITPDYFPEASAERLAYKEYLDNLQVIALGSVKQP